MFPHLDSLLQRLKDNFSEDDTLSQEGYIDLMASTTISSAMASSQHDEYDESNNFAHVFRLFDLDGKGYITIQDLERVASELGEHDMTREELEDMIKRAKAPSPQQHGNQSNKHPHEQRVSIDEFTRVMTMNLFPRGPAEQQA
jgi:Ca2+-binding EF-hand superfamily protein